MSERWTVIWLSTITKLLSGPLVRLEIDRRWLGAASPMPQPVLAARNSRFLMSIHPPYFLLDPFRPLSFQALQLENLVQLILLGQCQLLKTWQGARLTRCIYRRRK